MKSLIGAYNFRGLQLATITAGSTAEDRHGTGVAAESWYPDPQARAERANWEHMGFLKPQIQGHTSSNKTEHTNLSPNGSTNWRPSIQTYEPRRAILI